MNLLTVEVAQERMRDREEQVRLLATAARVRALRRARRDAKFRAIRVRRLLLAR